MNSIEITKFKKHYFPGERSAVVAEFSAQVNGFKMRRVNVRKSNETGRIFITTPNPNSYSAVISLPEGELRDEISAEVLELYERGATI